jgi:hemerythrin-like domain-containing protein
MPPAKQSPTSRTTSQPRTTATRATAGARSSRPAKEAVHSAKAASRTAKRAAPRNAVAKATGRSGGSQSSARRAQKTAQQPDAIELLTADHRAVEELFSRFEATGARAHKRREQLVEKMIAALSMHAAIEERVFYPAARREVPASNDGVLEALEEHHVVKWTLSELDGLDPAHERYAAKVMVLIESVRHHVEEEEGELFPQVRKSLGKQRLEELGRQLADAKSSAPTRPHPQAPDTPPGNIVAQTVTAPFDAVANVAGAAAKRVRDLVI